MIAFLLFKTNRGLEAIYRENIIIQRFLLGLLLLCLFAQSSCATTGRAARVYEGPELAKEKTAVLHFSPDYLKIYELNGKKSFDDGRRLFQGSHYRFIVLPGSNSLEFLIAPSGYTGPDRCYKADFDAVAGKDYFLSCIYTKSPGVTLGNKTTKQLTVDEVFIKDITGNEGLLSSGDAGSLRSAPSVHSTLVEVECPYKRKK
jgi:hypothetical protein